MTVVVTFTLKYMFAVPRPHFLAACQPNTTVLYTECGGDIFSDNLSPTAMFLPSVDTCIASSETVAEALRSFPSEHAALPAYSAVFLAAYLHRMMAFRRLVTARPMLIVLCLLGGATPGIGSLNAFQVRWVDLLVGYLLGASLALYLVSNVVVVGGGGGEREGEREGDRDGERGVEYCFPVEPVAFHRLSASTTERFRKAFARIP